MRWTDLILFLPPLMLAISIVVGTAGHQRGEIAGAVRNAFVAFTLGVLLVGATVRVLVIFFA